MSARNPETKPRGGRAVTDRRSFCFILCLGLLLVQQATLSVAAGEQPPAFSLPPFRESTAYRQFLLRPLSENSKLLFLIDRFANSKIEILYDGNYYNTQFAAPVARWFLMHHYQNESAEQFIMEWCNATVPAGNLVWVKLPDGSLRLAREILLGELKALKDTTP